MFNNLQVHNRNNRNNINFSSRTITSIDFGTTSGNLTELLHVNHADFKAVTELRTRWKTKYAAYIADTFQRQRENPNPHRKFFAIEVAQDSSEKNSLECRIEGLCVLTYDEATKKVKLDYIHTKPKKQRRNVIPNVGRTLLAAVINHANKIKADGL